MKKRRPSECRTEGVTRIFNLICNSRIPAFCRHCRAILMARGFPSLLCMVFSGIAASEWGSLVGAENAIRNAWLYSSLPILHLEVFLINFLFGASFFLFFRIIFARLPSLILSILFIFTFSAISLEKVRRLGVPLVPWDIEFVGKAFDLLDFIGARVSVLALLALIAAFFVLSALIFKWRTHIFRRDTFLQAACVGLIFPGAWVTAITAGGIDKISYAGIHNVTWDQQANFRNYGPFYAFFTNLKFISIAAPSAQVQHEADEVDTLDIEPSGTDDAHPNVVAILSESFTDLPVHIFGRPFSCLTESSSSKLATPAWGGFTANVEFELLTGYPYTIFPVGSVPYEMYIKYPVSQSLPNQFANAGYETEAIHTFARNFYSRPEAYQALGIKNYRGLENLPGSVLRGQYVSDQVIFDNVLRRLTTERRHPLFIHAVTMMAHLPYGRDGRYPIDPALASIFPHELVKYRLALLQYSSMIYDHEKMLCSFLHDLEKVKKRTLVLFYGDHYPSFGSFRVYQDVHAYIHHGDGVPFDIYGQYSRTPLFLFDNKAGFIHLPSVVPSYNLGTLLLKQAGLPLKGVWAMQHKLDDRLIAQGIYLAEHQSSREIGLPSNGTPPDSEFEVVKAHAIKHLLNGK